MRLTKIRGTDCADGRTCPAVHRTDYGTLMIIGQAVDETSSALPCCGQVGLTEIDVPAGLLPELVTRARHQANPDMIRLAGHRVTATEALSQMDIGPDEVAIDYCDYGFAAVLNAA